MHAQNSIKEKNKKNVLLLDFESNEELIGTRISKDTNKESILRSADLVVESDVYNFKPKS